jgi:hypothetical protein
VTTQERNALTEIVLAFVVVLGTVISIAFASIGVRALAQIGVLANHARALILGALWIGSAGMTLVGWGALIRRLVR